MVYRTAPPARMRFENATKAVAPPWLQRSIGGRFLGAIGKVVDDLVDRTALGVKARFPGLTDASDGLAYIGRDRLIRRGPNESDATYARRLRLWLDSHRTRGGPYALLEQLRAYWLDTLTVPIDVVYHDGTRRSIAADGTITRDSISWNPDGSNHWARIWIFFNLDDLHVLDVTADMITDDGDTLVTDDGDTLIAVLGEGTVTDEIAEEFALVPRGWSAAHVEQIHVVLLYPGARLWGYPRPVAKWGSGWGTWQTTNPFHIEVA